ncbi:MAG: ABC transporter permease, partial [Phycisphaeraceae bacterium]|nr:ABC transporter permease [Phycisphaeraceae bacterium]
MSESDQARLSRVAAIGSRTFGILTWAGEFAYLGLDTATSLFVDPFRHRPIRRRQVAEQMVRVGIKSLSVVLLVLFFVGLVLALQLAAILMRFGAVEHVGSVVGVAVTRELGPLMAAIVFTGFAGAALAAEIG